MRRFTLLAALSLAMLANVGASQQAAQVEPTQVRFVHASPNAMITELELRDVDGVPAVNVPSFTDLAYLSATPYVPVAEGNYEVLLRLARGDGAPSAEVVLPQSFGVVEGRSYTVAIIGLVVPEVFEEPDEGFLAWLQDLFTAAPHDPTLRALILDGVWETPVPPDEVDVRIAHAAPGTESIDLVIAHVNDTDGVLATVSYAEVSGYSTMSPRAGTLEIRLTDSAVVVVDLAGYEVTPGTRYTIMLTGTPIEDVPLRVLMLPDD